MHTLRCYPLSHQVVESHLFMAFLVTTFHEVFSDDAANQVLLLLWLAPVRCCDA